MRFDQGKERRLRYTATAAFLAILLSGCAAGPTAGTASSIPTSATSSPTTNEPEQHDPGDNTNSPAPKEIEEDTMVNGYDPQQVWNLCAAEGKKIFASVYISNDSYSPSAVTPPDPETGLTEGVFVEIDWKLNYKGQPVDSQWHCAVVGPASNPVISSITMPDK